MSTITDEQILHFVTTTLNPPVVWLILLLLFTEWKQNRRSGWNLLLVAWFCNIVYLYVESFEPTVVLGRTVSQFVAANLSLVTAVLFLTFALKFGRGYSRPLTAAAVSGGVIFAVSLVVSRQLTGSWSTPFRETSTTTAVSVAMYLPLIAFSFIATIACAATLRRQLHEARARIRRLIVAAWFLYGVLQLAYFLKFTTEKSYIVGAFIVAWVAKLSIAAGLFLLFKEDTELMHARRVTLQSQARQQVAFSWFAHELKNPVHALHFRAETLNRRLDLKDYPRARADAVKLVQSTTVLSSIVESVKLAAEPIDLAKLTYFSVNDAVTDALDQVKSAFHMDAGIIRSELGGNVPVCGLRAALVQVFSNLLRNAVEACADLSPEYLAQTGHAKVYVDTKRIGGSVRVRVIDYGPGISSDMIDSVFDPYYSTKQGINRGLGLWVVRMFVESFYGRVTITSPIERLSRGTIFAIVFPLADDDVEPARFFGTLKLAEVS